MTVTENLLRVFRVDQQLQGLQGRLQAAQKFLSEQSKQITGLDSKRISLHAQHKLLQATIANHEGETKRLDVRMATLREQMNSAKTNKEYKALLTEVNTLKADRDKAEEAALQVIAQADAVKAQLEELEGKKQERSKVAQVAATDRDKREEEIRDRVNELKAERQRLLAEVPNDTIKLYDALVKQHGDDAMAEVEEQDRKSHDFNCGRCMMAVPVETVSALLRNGPITRCVSCGVILFIESTLRDEMRAGPVKGTGKKKKASKAEA
jgi:uncharacterized protein